MTVAQIPMATDYLYCVTNASFPGACIVGLADSNPAQLIDMWNNRDMPYPFILEFAKQTANAAEKEIAIHTLLGTIGQRLGTSREYFSIPIETVRQLFSLVDGEWFAPPVLIAPPPPLIEVTQSHQSTQLVISGSPKTSRPPMNECFANGQRIRHIGSTKDTTWIGVYNIELDSIVRDSVAYGSPSGFAKAHYSVTKPITKNTTQVNGWKECEFEKSPGCWITTDIFRK